MSLFVAVTHALLVIATSMCGLSSDSLTDTSESQRTDSMSPVVT